MEVRDVVKKEISSAIARLGLAPELLREVEGIEGDRIFQTALAAFVRSGDRRC